MLNPRRDQIIQYLEIMVNDVTASPLFSKGPLSWFKIYQTFKNFCVKEDNSDKQMSLIEKVFQQYLFHKKISQMLVREGLDRKVIKAISNFLNSLPKSANSSEKSKRSHLGTIRSRLSNGDVLILKTLENIERIAVEINSDIVNPLLKDIQEVRLKYFQAYNNPKSGKVESAEKRNSDQTQPMFGIILQQGSGPTDISRLRNNTDEKMTGRSPGAPNESDKNYSHSHVYFTHGLKSVKDHKYRDAIESFSKSISSNDKHSRAWFYRGLTRCLLGEEYVGKVDIERAAKLGDAEAIRWVSSNKLP